MSTISLYKKLQRTTYYPELKQVGSMLAIVAFFGLLYDYGNQALAFMSSETGLVCSTFFFAAIAMAYCIKIYYRIIVIKYHEKDIRIRLFENI